MKCAALNDLADELHNMRGGVNDATGRAVYLVERACRNAAKRTNEQPPNGSKDVAAKLSTFAGEDSGLAYADAIAESRSSAVGKVMSELDDMNRLRVAAEKRVSELEATLAQACRLLGAATQTYEFQINGGPPQHMVSGTAFSDARAFLKELRGSAGQTTGDANGK